MSSRAVLDRRLLNAVSATTASATYAPRDQSTPSSGNAVPMQTITHFIQWGAGVNAGAVTIECADSATYTGTWAQIAVITNNGSASYEDYVQHPGSMKAIRHRVSTAVTGGTVTTRVYGVPA